MKSRLEMFVIVLAILLLVGCSGSDVDNCSIRQEAIDNPPKNAVTYTIHNQSWTTISTIFITPRQCDWWGVDWTGKEVLHPNESFTVVVPPGRYAVQFEDAVGYSYYDYNHKIKKDGEFVFSNEDGSSVDECPSSVTIANQSNQDISGFYVYRNGGMNWLGDDVIVPGESFQFLMVPAIIDVKVTVGEFEEIYLEKDVMVDHHITIAVTGD